MIAECSMRTRLVCAVTHLASRLAGRGQHSPACHYHAYELAPTVAELDLWMDAVEDLIRGAENHAPGSN